MWYARIWLSCYTCRVSLSSETKCLQIYKFSYNSNTRKIPSDMCAQRRLKSVRASVQSDQILCCPHDETLSPRLSKMRLVMILIILRECTGWSKSTLATHVWNCELFWPFGSFHSKHTLSQQRRYNVAATSWRCSDVVTMLCVCLVDYVFKTYCW